MMNRRLATVLAVLIGLGCGLGGCRRGPADLTQAPLSSAHIGGPFTLIDDHGHPFTQQQLAGKFYITYFGYTSCPDACPTDVQEMMAAYKIFAARDPADAAKLVPLFISVDPARDTPTQLHGFVNAFDSHLVGLTGTDAQIAAVAKSYAAVYMRGKPNAAGQYLVDHSRVAMLFGPQGQPIMILSVGKEGTPEQIAAELATWVR